MEIRKGFYDLCVPYVKNSAELEATLNELYDGMLCKSNEKK